MKDPNWKYDDYPLSTLEESLLDKYQLETFLKTGKVIPEPKIFQELDRTFLGPSAIDRDMTIICEINRIEYTEDGYLLTVSTVPENENPLSEKSVDQHKDLQPTKTVNQELLMIQKTDYNNKYLICSHRFSKLSEERKVIYHTKCYLDEVFRYTGISNEDYSRGYQNLHSGFDINKAELIISKIRSSFIN